MWRRESDALPLAELGEAPPRHSGSSSNLLDRLEPQVMPAPLQRLTSMMTGSEASLPGPRRKEQRRKEWLNAELLSAVLGNADLETITKLLDDGAEANAVCSPTRTSVLQLCALRGARPAAEVVAVATLLLERGAELQHRDHADNTVLHLAAYSGAADLIELILSRNKAETELLAGLLAVRTREPREAEEREPYPTAWNDSWHHEHDTVASALPYLELGSTALHVACRRVHLRCIRLLTIAGADRSILDDRGRTPIDVLHEDPGLGEDGDEEDVDAGEQQTAVPSEDTSDEQSDWVEVDDTAVESRSDVLEMQRRKMIARGETSVKLGVVEPPPGSPKLRVSSHLPVVPLMAPATPQFRLAPPPSKTPVRTTSADTRLLEAIGWLKADGKGDFATGSALHTAVTNGCLKVVENLLNVDPSAASAVNAQGDTPVHAAIAARNLEALRLLMKANEPAINEPDSNGYTPCMLAVSLGWNEGVSQLLLGSANLAARDRTGSTVLHDAAVSADTNLLRELLSLEESYQVLNAERQDGFTPLFVAVESNNTDRVQLFIEAGANLTHTLPNGVNVLHFALQTQRGTDVAMISYLAGRLGSSPLPGERDMLNALQSGDLDPGLAPLHLAAKSGDAGVVRLLLQNNCNPRVRAARDRPNNGGTALHIAAQYGHLEVVQTLMDRDETLLSARDVHDWRPIHKAAHFAQRAVLRYMINAGADLATAVRDEENRWCSALSLLIDSVAQPVSFLDELLNESVALNEFPVSDHRARIDVRYDILIPSEDRVPKCYEDIEAEDEPLKGDDDVQCRRQMRVIDAILGSGNYFGQQALLQHPLVESFLTLKWNKMAPFFYAIVAVHVLFVFALTSLVAQIYWWAGDQGAGVQVARFGVFVTATIIALQELLHFIQLRVMYIKDLESWLKLIAISLSVVVAFVVFEGVEQHQVAAASVAAVPTVAEGSTPSPAPAPGTPLPGLAESGVQEVRGVRRDLIWVRHVTTLAVLLSYTELLLLLCRFPRWGLRVLMFYKVAINVIKMVLTFSFLIVGFALSFFVQFRGFDPFPTLLESLGKTIVMGTAEFDYGDIFVEGNDTAVGRILFFTFLLLVPVVLMNLLVGLAVSDIATLETKGRTRGLVKQAEFLSTLERLVYSHSVRWCIPSRMRARLPIYIPVSRTVTIYPGQSLRIIFEVFPEHIRDEIVKIAIDNASSKQPGKSEEPSTCAHHDIFGASDEAKNIYDEMSQIRREMVSRKELLETSERQERHIRTLLREVEAMRTKIDTLLTSHTSSR